MRGIWVAVLVVLIPSALQAQAEISIKMPVTKIGCETRDANLAVGFGSGDTKLYVLLNNYTTVLENARKASKDAKDLVLDFPIQDSSNGQIYYVDNAGTRWYMHKEAAAGAQCDAKVYVLEGNHVRVNVDCKDLTRSSLNLTLAEKSAIRIGSLDAQGLTCEVRPSAKN